jgi:hypothetical protein
LPVQSLTPCGGSGCDLASVGLADRLGPEYLATLKTLLDEVNARDRRGVEAVLRGVRAPLAKADI